MAVSYLRYYCAAVVSRVYFAHNFKYLWALQAAVGVRVCLL